MKNNIGTLELITFRTTRDYNPYLTPLTAMAKGLSSGHIALRLNFFDTELFEQYIQNNTKIPHRIKINSITGRPEYEVYVSFWPHGEYATWANSGILQNYKYDCEQSCNYSPLLYDPRFEDYLHPIEKISASPLLVLRKLFTSTIKLPPTIILHSIRLGLAYGDKINLIPNKEVVEEAEKYVARYREWRSAIVLEQNAKFTYEESDTELLPHKRRVKIAMHRMLISQRTLKNLMFPDRKLSNEEFSNELENFVTFGYPERDIISLPLIDHSRGAGLELEPMLKYIADIANNPMKYPYNVFKSNCAKIIMNIIWQGGKESKYKEVSEEFSLPWYVRWLGITLTPILIMQQAEKIQALINSINEKLVDPEQLMINDYALIRPKAKTLKFYNNQREDPDELPTTRVAILAKLLENFSANVRT